MLIVSLILQLSAAAWSLALFRRYQDRRLLIVPLVIGVIALDPLIKLFEVPQREGGLAVLHTLVESFLVLLIPLFLDQYFRSQRNTLDSSRRSEHLFRALAENSLGLICQHDLQGTLLFINPAAAGALGFQPRQLIGKSVRDALAPSVRHEFSAYLERIRINKADSGMMRVAASDGSERTWLYRNVLYEGLGEAPCVLGHALDVTDLKAAEKLLRKIQQELETRVKERTAELARFRTMMDQAGVAIFITDESRRFIDVNETACQHTGYSREELMQLGPGDLAVDLDLPAGNDWRIHGAELSESGISIAVPEHLQRRKDGSTFPVQVNVSARSFEGKTLILAVSRDITEQKRTQDALRQAEEELRQLFSSVSDYLWSADFDREGRVVYRYYSPVVETITGRPPEFYMSGPHQWLSTVHPEDRPAVREHTERFLRGHEEQTEVEYRIVLPGGEVRWLRDSVTAKKLGDGTTRLNGVVSDITERKAAEQQRHLLEAQLRQSQRLESLGVLAGGIAHDFNNILTSIMGFTSLVETDLPEDSTQRANLREVLRASERAKELVQQILTFSRRSGQDRRPIDIAAAVSEALGLVRRSIPLNVELRLRIRPDSGSVLADGSCIHQIVLSLSTNAFHALEPSGGAVEVSLEPVELDPALARRIGGLNPGPHAKLTVSDNGPGIAPAVRERVFDPFFTTKDVGQGSGLGLSMVHGIVSTYGGVVQLEDRQEPGATFAIYLPRLRAGGESVPDGAKSGTAGATGA